ncbi:hypothetical protein [Coraliomargarita parva]|uniref:hypothetical protein n=1 Tax=Coraliomargarita parva TaxID=3014050 RepID=UPI0022B55C47|nr:hypothetical protein [Coraliomargarita parva]
MKRSLTPQENEERERLDRIRAKDPNETVRLHELNVLQSALEFRYGKRNLPKAFYDFLELKGIEIEGSILISAADWEQGTNPLFGEILSQEEKFYSYDLDFTKDGTGLLEENEWIEVTEEKNLREHNRGVPKTYYKIAVEVLRKLRSEQVSGHNSGGCAPSA